MTGFGRSALFFAVLTSGFVLSQFFRTAGAVTAPILRQKMGLGPSLLGIVTGAFFLAIALMQLPVGALLDRYGPRRVMSGLMGVAAAGTAIFAAADGAPLLILGQLVIGIGCAASFVGGLAVIARWYPPERFSVLGALMTAISGLGTAASGTPFAALTESFGWRASYVALGGITFLVGLLLRLYVRDAPPGHPFHARRREGLAAALGGIGEVFAARAIWAAMTLIFMAYAASVTVRGLWGGPYLADVHGLDAIARGNVLLAMSLAGSAGALLYGAAEARGVTRLRLIAFGTVASVVGFGAAAATSLAASAAIALLVLLGAVAPLTIFVIGHARLLFPDRLTGRAITVLNFANFLGVFAMQAWTGWLLDAFPRAGEALPEDAYRTMFAAIGACLVLAGLVFWRWGASRRSTAEAPVR
jgi:MFS family permease